MLRVRSASAAGTGATRSARTRASRRLTRAACANSKKDGCEMTTSNLDQVIEEVKALSPDDQRKLREWLDRLLAPPTPQMTEEEFEQHLLAKGVISEIPPRIIDPIFEQNRKPIEIEGKPVSEIIIEERR